MLLQMYIAKTHFNKHDKLKGIEPKLLIETPVAREPLIVNTRAIVSLAPAYDYYILRLGGQSERGGMSECSMHFLTAEDARHLVSLIQASLIPRHIPACGTI